MSQLTDLYESSEEQRPKESREQIPGGAVDFFDREHAVQKGFKTGQKRGSPSSFTPEAQDQYNKEKDELTPPESFDASKPLHRYTPENSFFSPGQPE